MDISSVSMLGQMGQMSQMGNSRPAGPPPGGEKPDPSQMSTQMLEENDSDGDGYLSIDEFNISEEMFSAADTDSDGLLSQEELISSITARMEEMEANGPPPPPEGEASSVDMSQFKTMLADMSSQSEAATESTSTQDQLTALLEQMGLDEDQQQDVLDMLQDNTLNILA